MANFRVPAGSQAGGGPKKKRRTNQNTATPVSQPSDMGQSDVVFAGNPFEDTSMMGQQGMGPGMNQGFGPNMNYGMRPNMMPQGHDMRPGGPYMNFGMGPGMGPGYGMGPGGPRMSMGPGMGPGGHNMGPGGPGSHGMGQGGPGMSHGGMSPGMGPMGPGQGMMHGGHGMGPMGPGGHGMGPMGPGGPGMMMGPGPMGHHMMDSQGGMMGPGSMSPNGQMMMHGGPNELMAMRNDMMSPYGHSPMGSIPDNQMYGPNSSGPDGSMFIPNSSMNGSIMSNTMTTSLGPGSNSPRSVVSSGPGTPIGPLSGGPPSTGGQQNYNGFGVPIGPSSHPSLNGPITSSSEKLYPPGQPLVVNPQNPSAPPIYPCGICRKEVNDSDQAILCESGCNFWFHRICTGLQEPAFHYLTQEVYAEWVCDQCFRDKNVPLIKIKC